MKKTLKLALVGTMVGFMAGIVPFTSYADTWVNGYTRSNGTYVQGHHRSSPNSTRNDNYSTRGNRNPYTGSYGTKPRDNSFGSYGSSRRNRSLFGNH